MKINRQNYEAFFLDYHEGQLGEAGKQEVLLFLREHPDLKDEFDAFEIIEVSPPAQTFPGKELLKKKGITTENYVNYFIAYAEGDLSSSDRREVEQFASANISLQKELELFGKLKITPDPKIVFKNKNSLRRQTRVIQLNAALYRYAAAAVLALLVMTYFYMDNEKEPVLSQKETVQPTSAPMNTEQKELPNDNPGTSPVVAANNGKNEEAPGEKQQVHAQRGTPQAVQPSPEPVAFNTETPVTARQKEAPVLADGTSQANDQDPAKASTASNEKAQEKFKPTNSDLREVFSDEELKELGIASNDEDQKKRSLWDIAAKGAAGIGKLTGTPIAMNKSDDTIEETKTVALNVGKFSVSHTSGR